GDPHPARRRRATLSRRAGEGSRGEFGKEVPWGSALWTNSRAGLGFEEVACGAGICCRVGCPCVAISALARGGRGPATCSRRSAGGNGGGGRARPCWGHLTPQEHTMTDAFFAGDVETQVGNAEAPAAVHGGHGEVSGYMTGDFSRGQQPDRPRQSLSMNFT